MQLLQDEIENETAGNAMSVLRISSPRAAAQLASYRLKLPMDGILSQAQSKVWLGLITADTQLLLDNTQRKHLQTSVEVFAPLSRRNSPPISMFFLLFQRQRNLEILTPWQQGEFKRVFGPIALER